MASCAFFCRSHTRSVLSSPIHDDMLVINKLRLSAAEGIHVLPAVMHSWRKGCEHSACSWSLKWLLTKGWVTTLTCSGGWGGADGSTGNSRDMSDMMQSVGKETIVTDGRIRSQRIRLGQGDAVDICAGLEVYFAQLTRSRAIEDLTIQLYKESNADLYRHSRRIKYE